MQKKYFRLVALGLLCFSGSYMASRLFHPLTDFQLGLLNGIGIGIIIFALIRSRRGPHKGRTA